jgi:hypothetical protein
MNKSKNILKLTGEGFACLFMEMMGQPKSGYFPGKYIEKWIQLPNLEG